MKDAWNPWTTGVSHLNPVPGPAPEHPCPLPADLPGRFRGQGRVRGCPHRGCRAVEEEMLLLPGGRPRAREAAPGSGAPPRGCLLCFGGKCSFHCLPPRFASFSPSLFFFFPSSLPASHSCCLGDPDLVREERGSGVRAAASAGWRGAAVG